MRVEKFICAFCLMCLIQGCDQINKVDKLSADVSEANNKISVLENQVSELSNELENLKKDREFEKFISGLDGIAYLTPGSQGYSVVSFDLGKLTVQISDVKPYANGSKVTLKFGNTLLVAVNGVTAIVDWGEVDEQGSPKNEVAKTKEVTFNEQLKPGSWVPATVVLEGVPPEKLGFVRIKNIHHTGIELLK